VEGNELMVGDDPTTIEVWRSARLADQRENPSHGEPPKWLRDSF